MKLSAITCAARRRDRRGGARARTRRRTGFPGRRSLFGPLWLLARGVWLALLAYVALAAAIVVLAAFGWIAAGRRGGADRARPSLSRRSRDARSPPPRASARGRPMVDVIYAGSALEAEKVLFRARAAPGLRLRAPRRARAPRPT